MVIGMVDGQLVQLDQALKPKKVIPAPPSFKDQPRKGLTHNVYIFLNHFPRSWHFLTIVGRGLSLSNSEGF